LTTGATIGTKGDVSALNIGGDLMVTPALRVAGLFGYGENKGDFGSGSGNFKLSRKNNTVLVGLKLAV
jgi:hypothetical protein